MAYVTERQPTGTPTWIDLGVPDLQRGMRFYGTVLGWDFESAPAEMGGYTFCLLRGRPVAGMVANARHDVTGHAWNVYFATDDCDATVIKVIDAGGTLIDPPEDVTDQGRMATARDTVGAQFGLWEGRAHIGAQIVNEPGALVRNDLVTPSPGPARTFYRSVFGYTLDENPALIGMDFTFLRRPDGHEIGGIIGQSDVPSSTWTTTFEVDDTDATVERAVRAGGTSDIPYDFTYGRLATITDPFGAEFSVISRPADEQDEQ